MSGHNEAPTTFQRVLPEVIRGILKDAAAFGRDQHASGGATDPEKTREAERAFVTSMEGLYAHLGRQLEPLDRPLAAMSEQELEALAEKLAATTRGG